MSDLKHYRYGGARALVILHEQELRAFFDVWKQARAAAVLLPETEDPDYASLETLLWHVFRGASSYMIWMCRMLELPDPGIRPAPEPEAMSTEAAAYLEHVIERWRLPLEEITEDACYSPSYTSGWGAQYCIDAMLEHAAMHPKRHRFQLEELMTSA